MASPELRIMSSAPRATPLSSCARFTVWSESCRAGAVGAHPRPAVGDRDLGLAGRVGGRTRLGAVRFGDDLPAHLATVLDDLADVAGPHELVVLAHRDLAGDAVEAEAVHRG